MEIQLSMKLRHLGCKMIIFMGQMQSYSHLISLKQTTSLFIFRICSDMVQDHSQMRGIMRDMEWIYTSPS